MDKILKIVFFIALFFSVPEISYANWAEEEKDSKELKGSLVNDETAEVEISVKGGTVKILNAKGHMLEVYSITGIRVKLARIENMTQTFDLNLTKGCYIIKVGRTTRKLNVL